MCLLENTHDKGEVRILLVEHHTAVREAIAFAFERGAGFEVVAQAASLSEARGMVEGIDVAVVDLGLPDGYEGDQGPYRNKLPGTGVGPGLEPRSSGDRPGSGGWRCGGSRQEC
jgi:hypothetical protein